MIKGRIPIGSRIATVVLVAVCGLLAAGTGAQGQLPPTALNGASSGASGPSPSSIPGLSSQLAHEEQAIADRRRDRKSPAALNERRRSRNRFGAASDSEAVATSRDAFERLLFTDAQPLFDLEPGEEVVRYLSQSSARIESSNGEGGLVASTLPLRVRNDAGRLAQVDLDLRDDGAGFEANNPVVDIALPDRLSRGITLEDEDVTVTPAGVARDVDATQTADETLFYANAQKDTDWAATVVPKGIELSAVLRSSESPDVLPLELDVPAGASLRLDPSHRRVEVVKGGEVVARVNPAVGFDADGTPVPTAYEIDGETVSIVVEHSKKDFHYPLLIDPLVSNAVYDESFAGWTPWANSSFYTSGGNYVAGWYGAYYFPEMWGGYSYNVPHGSDASTYIYRTEFKTAVKSYCCNPALYVQGVVDGEEEEWKSGFSESPTSGNGPSPWGSTQALSNDFRQHCTPSWAQCVPNGDPGAQSSGDWAAFLLATTAYGYMEDAVALSEARVFMADKEDPVVDSDPEFEDAWTSASSLGIAPAAEDEGLGIYAFEVAGYRPNGSTHVVTHQTGCDGTRVSPCPQYYEDAFNVATAQFRDGVSPLWVRAQDPTGRWSGWQQMTGRLDRTAPEIEFDGSLSAKQGRTLDDNSPYELSIHATDGTGVNTTTSRSGVAGIQLLLRKDGGEWTEVDEAADGCATESCDANLPWALEAGELLPGRYEAMAIAVDEAGNDRERSLEFVVPVTEADPSGAAGTEERFTMRTIDTGADSEANVNVATGNLVWQTTPLSNPGRGLDTVASLTYNSKRGHEADRTPSELSPGFSFGLSTLSRVNDRLDVNKAGFGIVSLVDSDGTRHRFSSAVGSGDEFAAPPGVDLRLRRFTQGASQQAWAVTTVDGVTYYFDELGLQRSVQDRNGNVMQFQYEARPLASGQTCDPATAPDACKRLTSVTDPAGIEGAGSRAVTLTYVSGTGQPDSGKLRRLTDHAGRQTEFGYDTHGRLAQMTQADGTSAERSFGFTYTGDAPDSVLAKIIDPEGHETKLQFEYDPEDPLMGARVEAVEDRKGETTEVEVDDANPTTETHVYDQLGEPTRYTTDEDSRLVESEDARGTVTQQQWDADDNVVKTIEAAGTADATETVKTFNEHGQVTSETDPNGDTTTYEYREGAGTQVAGVDAGETFVSDLESITEPGETTTSLELDTKGNVVAETDPAGFTTEKTYDGRGQMTSETDEMGEVTAYSSFDPNGLPRVETDPRGTESSDPDDGRWYQTYDAVGNVRSVTDPRGAEDGQPGDALPHTTTITYDALDRPVSEASPKLTEGGETETVTTTTEYDDNGNVTAEVDAEGAREESQFSPTDEVTEVRAPATEHADEAGAEEEVTELVYDEADNLIEETAPEGSESAEEGDNVTEYVHNEVGELVAQIETSTEGGETDELATSYAYDRLGQVVGVVDPERNAEFNDAPEDNALDPERRRVSYDYDAAGNKTSEIEDPGGQALQTTWTYDENGNPVTETDPVGATTVVSYDERGLVTAEEGPEGERTEYELRPDGLPEKVTSPNGVASETEGDFEKEFEYYPTGELKSETIPAAPDQYGPDDAKVEYERDSVGNPTTIVDARGYEYPQRVLRLRRAAFYEQAKPFLTRCRSRPGGTRVALAGRARAEGSREGDARGRGGARW